SLAAIALSACAYTCNRSDYGCKHEASMNVVCLVRQKCLPHPSDTGGRPMGALMTQVMDIGRIRNLSACHKNEDFRALARRNLPLTVCHSIDGAADVDATKARNRATFDDVDLVARVEAGVESIDTSVTVLLRKAVLLPMLSPTAHHRLCYGQVERAFAA